MSYIGNQPISAAFLTDTFSGNGSTVAFTMTVAPANTSSIIVAITGVLQDPSTYSVSGTTLTFSAAPPSGTSNISVRYLGIPASGVTTTAYRTVTNTTATAGQTSFTIPSYTVGYVDVYRNGVYLPTSDYTATTGTTVVLTNAATVGDTITTISFYVSSVLNAIPNSPASVGTSNIVSGVSLTSPTLITPALGTPASGVMTNVTSVPAAQLTGSRAIPASTMPTGSVLQVVQTTNTAAFTTTSTSYVTLMTVSITPSSASNKVLITFGTNGGTNGDVMHGYVAIFRGATQLFKGDAASNRTGATNVINTATQVQQYYGGTYLDSPATTSAISYTIQVLSSNGSTLYINRSARDTDLSAYDGRTVSSVTVMEIAA